MTNIVDDRTGDEPDAAASSVSMPPILFKGEIEIFPNQRLSYLDRGSVKAYAARTRTGMPAFALCCERHLVPHIHSASKYFALSNPGLPKLLGTGLVDWPSLRQHRYVFIYENKLGKPIAHHSSSMSMGLKPDVVLSTVIKNIVPVLKEMRDADFVHGAISLQNLFDGAGTGLEKVMLGECLSTPAGYLNSVVYETIERATTDPIARGLPTYEDDMYAFGALLAVLMRPSNPFPDYTDEELIKYKIEHGSYAALTGRERFTGTILELLRGLLQDDVKQRWTIDDVLIWMDGRRVPSKQSTSIRLKANRPLDIDHNKFLYPEDVALYLAKAPTSTGRVIDNGDMHMWLTRSIQDKQLEAKVEASVNLARSHGSSGLTYDDRLTGFLSMALAPNYPLMYRGLKLMPQGFGRSLVDAICNRRDVNPYIEIIQTQMVSFWINCVNRAGLDTTEILQFFETCRAFMRQSVIGYGIERCAYYLAPEAPCLSDNLKDYHVRTAEELLLAYEDMASKGNRPDSFFDRHVIAFLSVRDRSVIDQYLPEINSPEKHRQMLAAMRVFAAIQKRSKLPSLPYVGAWLIQGAEIAVNRFHDRDKRQKMREQISGLKDKGDLSKLLVVFDNASSIKEDMPQFRMMIAQFINLRKEYARLEFDLENDTKFGYETGHQASAVVSGLIAGFSVLMYLIFGVGH